MKHRPLLVLVLAILFSFSMIRTGKATPGISVTITAIDPIIVALGDTATYTVTTESITTEE